ncbi:GTP-binding protein [Thomasclavelia saccharogumia]|uniref:GTP-binding protein n=1 Tax=Thomasclavelia saccharogumia TaxID=341225 RepID=UPI00047E0309|nr:GTP-binding protein [Thomasclavelia saccharogumia]
MIKIDLITGFLGSGKTTFIKKYANYLLKKGYKIGIIENDFGAVNVDMMLLQDVMGDKCELEMISGGCDEETHRRRFKTKLIAMKMLRYDRILIEPSGIYDVDEFFDVLYEEPLNKWYEIGNVIAIVDAKLENNLSKESDYLLASQVANAGCVILSKSQDASKAELKNTVDHLNKALKQVQCKRRLENEIICKNWDDLKDQDFNDILSCGYQSENYVKLSFDQSKTFTSLYFMNVHLSKEKLLAAVKALMDDSSCGKIFRIKGFMQLPNDEWIELNATHHEISIKPIKTGQEVIIVIGEGLIEKKIENYWNK